MKTVNDFGADPSGLNDSSSAFQRASDSDETSIKVPSGRYLVNGFTVRKPMRWIGEGENSTIYSNKLDATVMTIATNMSCLISDMRFDTVAPRTGGSYICVSSNNVYPNGGTEVDTVVFASPYIGIDWQNAARWSVTQCYFANYTQYAISVADVLQPDNGDSNIDASVFDAGGPTGIGIAQWSSGGLRITNNKFLNGSYHYLGQFNTTTQPTSILLVSNNSFEWARGASVALNSSGATFNFLMINNNQFSLLDGASGVLVQNPLNGLNFLSGGVIGNNLFNTTGKKSTSITFNSGKELLVSPNNTTGYGTAISFGNNLQRITVCPQAVSAGVTKYTGSTKNVIFI